MKYFYTLLFIALPCIILAQSNYHEGYVIKNDGDTLKGFIDYHEWEQNPKTINFKISKDERHTLNFDPRTIKEFNITGFETYVAYQGIISIDKNKFPDLPMGLDTSKKQDSIFLQRVTNGKYLTLFYHRDAIKTRFFVAEKNTTPVELKYYQYSDQGQLAIKEFYKGQLLFYANKYMPGDPKLAQKIEDTRFDKTGLTEIISAINGESNSEKKGAFFRFFVGGGLNNTQSHFRDNNELIDVFTQVGPLTEVDRYPEKVSKFSTTVSPRINVGIDVFTNPEVQKMIFRTELSFSYNSPKFQYMVAGSGANINQTYSFDQYTATVTPQIMLNLYNKNNFKIYMDGGIGLNLSAYSNTHLSKGTASDLQSFWVNFPVQAGIMINKKAEISLTYESTASLVNYFDYFGVSTQYLSVGVRYLLSTH